MLRNIQSLWKRNTGGGGPIYCSPLPTLPPSVIPRAVSSVANHCFLHRDRTGNTTSPAIRQQRPPIVDSIGLRAWKRSYTLENAFSLTIANPASLLNNIAHRYSSTSRIIMEFIDNPLDDVEELFRANKSEQYPYPVEIIVTFDVKSKTLQISDNCTGMNYLQLANIIKNVGESSKKGVSWLNGQFGFGVHSFRAAASHLKVISKKEGSDPLLISLDRNQTTGITPPIPYTGTFNKKHGTEISISGFDSYWWKDVSLESIVNEIEQHFERLLSRKNLFIIVREVVGEKIIREKRCEPFDYSTVDGVTFNKELRIDDTETGGPGGLVKMHIVVSVADMSTYKVRFFSQGRRIAEASSINSFLNYSVNKRSLWSHPQLVGYIDTGHLLEPVITRDEFKRSKLRGDIYKRIVETESELKKQLESEMERQKDLTFGSLSGILEGVLSNIEQEDKKELRKLERDKKKRLEEAMKEQVTPTNDNKVAEPIVTVSSESPAIPDAVTHAVEGVSDTSLSPPQNQPSSVQQQPESTEPSSESSDTSSSVAETDNNQSPLKQPYGVSLITTETPNTTPHTSPEEKKEEHPTTTTTTTTPTPLNSTLNNIDPKLQPQKTATPKPKEGPHQKVSGYHINFISLPASPEGNTIRSHMVDDRIDINTLHPDFSKRVKYKFGRAVFTESLASYLAIIISSHYNNSIYLKRKLDPDREQVFDDLISLSIRFENALKRKIPLLQKSLLEVMKTTSNTTSDDLIEQIEDDYDE